MADFDPTKDPVACNWGRVMSHVLQKGVQAGGVLGVGLVAPAVLVAHKCKGEEIKDAAPKVLTAFGYTTAAMVALSGTMGVVRMARSPNFKEGVEDRAYRLHYNTRQSRADLFANIGLAAGGAAAVALLPATAAIVVIGGAAAGAAAGVVAHVLTSPKANVRLPAVADM